MFGRIVLSQVQIPEFVPERKCLRFGSLSLNTLFICLKLSKNINFNLKEFDRIKDLTTINRQSPLSSRLSTIDQRPAIKDWNANQTIELDRISRNKRPQVEFRSKIDNDQIERDNVLSKIALFESDSTANSN